MSLSRSTTAQILNLSAKALGGLAGALVISNGKQAVASAETIGASLGASLGAVCMATNALNRNNPAMDSKLDSELEKHWQTTLSSFVPILLGGSILLALTTSEADQRVEYLKNAFLFMTIAGAGFINGLLFSAVASVGLEASFNKLNELKQRLFATNSCDKPGEKEIPSPALSRRVP